LSAKELRLIDEHRKELSLGVLKECKKDIHADRVANGICKLLKDFHAEQLEV
jgi:hypothetical protein